MKESSQETTHDPAVDKSVVGQGGLGSSGGGFEDRKLSHLGLIIIFGIFATTLAQPQTLGRLPITFLLKDQLHIGKEEISRFFFLCGLAWYFKPVAGILVDAFPLFRTRRRWYMIIGATLACASWIAIAFVPKTYTSLLYTSIVINAFMVIASTATGAFLVEAGQSMGATGRLTALRLFVQNFCTLIQGPLGGWLASGAFAIAAGANAFFILTMVPIAYFFLRERPQEVNNAQAFANAGRQLKIIGKSGTLWFAIIFIGLFYFAPGFGTPLTFRQSDELHFSKQFIGTLGSFGGGAGILAAVVYGFLTKRIALRPLMFFGVAAAASGTLFYLLYNNSVSAMLIDSQNGFFFTLAELTLLDLAARATPKGCEGLGYSLILSMRNVALFGADWVGSYLADDKGPHWSFSKLVFLNAGTTAFVLILIPLLPSAIMRSRDRDQATG